jgi:hypothetical protein
MSRVTYPHLGSLYITSEHFFRALGLEPVTPPFPSRRTLDLGVRHCPEMTCAPCKILFGNYYEGLELGAPTSARWSRSAWATKCWPVGAAVVASGRCNRSVEQVTTGKGPGL